MDVNIFSSRVLTQFKKKINPETKMYTLPRVTSTSNELRHCLGDIILYDECQDKPSTDQ